MRRKSKSKSENAKLQNLVLPLVHWFSEGARDLPWRRTRDPYAIWVSEIMLQQTQVRTVIPYWERWMHELPTIRAAAKASPARLHKLWEGLGYYTRVRNLQRAAKQIIAQHSGKFPENFDDLLALPGIGRYTAGAICSIAFDQRKPILDGNVIRVLTRIFGIHENPREKKTNARLWRLAEALVREADKTEACSPLNQSLMELGALVCTPRAPNCTACPVRRLCVAYRERKQEELPNPAKRVTTTQRHFIAFIAEHRGRLLVRQRPTGVVNAHLWEFPNVEVNGSNKNPSDVCKTVFGVMPIALERLCVLKHSITRYRITLEAHRVRLKRRSTTAGGTWRTPAQIESLAFSSAHKKLASLASRHILTSR
jgi:A/G-specific adenine glycosylase